MLPLAVFMFFTLAYGSVTHYEGLLNNFETHFNFLKQQCYVEDEKIVAHSVYSVLEDFLSGIDRLLYFRDIALPSHTDLHHYVKIQGIIAETATAHHMSVLADALASTAPPAPKPDPFHSFHQKAISEFNMNFEQEDREKLFSLWKASDDIIKSMISLLDNKFTGTTEFGNRLKAIVVRLHSESLLLGQAETIFLFLKDLITRAYKIDLDDPVHYFVNTMPSLKYYFYWNYEIFVRCIRILEYRELDPLTYPHVLFRLFLHAAQCVTSDFYRSNPGYDLHVTFSPLQESVGLAVNHIFGIPLGTPLFGDIEMTDLTRLPFVRLCHLIARESCGWLSNYLVQGDFSPAAFINTLMPNIVRSFIQVQQDLNRISHSVTFATCHADEFMFFTFAAEAGFLDPWADEYADVCSNYNKLLTICLLYRVVHLLSNLPFTSDFVRFLPKHIPEFESIFALHFYRLIAEHVLSINYNKAYDSSIFCDVQFTPIPFSSDFETAACQCNRVLSVIVALHRYFVQFKMQPQLFRHFSFPFIIKHVLNQLIK